MKSPAWIVLILAALVESACTGMGIYHVAEKLAPADGVYLLNPDGSEAAGSGQVGGRYPSVGANGSVLVLVKPHTESATGVTNQQIWWGNTPGSANVVLTHAPGDKRYPRWGARWYAYDHDTGGGVRKIEVSAHNNSNQFTLNAAATYGLDFFDGGTKIVFANDQGINWIAAEDGATAMLVRPCGPPTTIRCRHPVVSHNGQLLAYRETVMLAAQWVESIIVAKATTLQLVTRITLQPPADLGGGGSLDFSPDDSRLIVTARATDVADPDRHKQLELFSIKLDGTGQQRITNNLIPDHSPATLNISTP